MNKQAYKRVTPARIVAFLLTVIPVMIMLLIGVAAMIGGCTLNGGALLCFILIPLIVMVLIGINMFSHETVWEKIVWVLGVYAIAIPIVIVIVIVSLCVGQLEDIEVYKGNELPVVYEERVKGDAFLPSLDEIGKPVEWEYCDYISSAMIFTCDTDVLICRYTPEDYAAQKAAIDSRYTFRTDPYTYREFVCEPQAELDGYRFRMINSPEVIYPRRLGFIATNDETCEIVWMSFTDDEMDYIEDLASFIEEDCGWKYIR